jgi:hypothetical protein
MTEESNIISNIEAKKETPQQIQNMQIQNTQQPIMDIAEEIVKECVYEPLTFDSYKFFVKFSPFIEKIILNNVNKHFLQSSNQNELQEMKAFSKMDKEFSLNKELLSYINPSNFQYSDVNFNCNFILIYFLNSICIFRHQSDAVGYFSNYKIFE